MSIWQKIRNLKSSVEELSKLFVATKISASKYGLDYRDLPFSYDSIVVAKQAVLAISQDQKPSFVWICHVESEIDRLAILLEDFGRRAPTMVTVRQAAGPTDIERAKRRIQSGKFFGRNRAGPVRIHLGCA